MSWLKLSEGKRKYKKPILRVGNFTKDSEGIQFDIEQEHLNYQANAFSHRIPVPLEHTTDPEMNRGWMVGVELDGEYLNGIFELSDLIEDPEIYDTSVYIPIKDGKMQPIEHVALTSYPVIDGLGNFQAIACSLNPRKEEEPVPFDWKAFGTALCLSTELTEENAVTELTKLFTGLSEKNRDLELKLSKIPADSPKINITAIKEKHGKLFEFAKGARKGKIESLKLSKKVQEMLVDLYCGDESLALALSEGASDSFDKVIEALEQNEPLEFDELSSLQLSDPAKGKKKESGLVAQAKARREAAIAKGGRV